ncbi:helix-turn-helix domain-containing protein [Robertkochia aurantiaca]|uniref:helix-turn-helix domain-containing protein n=1 Tax=Robertkochia aurantiaca TaxID=2873700 RepID=UPI001CCB6252|nr:helix-turn-helix domain-containing protein [Robertkochia sp. 3YJGBD-33]
MGNRPVSMQSDVLIKTLSRIVNENLDREEFNVETFAQLSGMCRSELYRKIKKHTGKSVTAFVRDIRLKKSLEYLSQGNLTASEVAYKVGFSSPTYFNTCFKQKYGFTPGEATHHPKEVKEILRKSPLEKGNNSSLAILRLPEIVIAVISALTLASILLLVHKYSSEQNQTDIPGSAVSSEINMNKSIAVLPLKNWTGEEDHEYIAYGITNALITELVQTGYFERVAPIGYVMAYKDSLLDISRIANSLKVENILHGSVEKAGDQLKFSLEFIHPESNHVFWTDQFIIDWKPEETFEMQNIITSSVLIALNQDQEYQQSPMFPDERRIPETPSSKAYDLRARGIYQTTKFTKSGWENGIQLLKKAVEEDPDYLQAYRDLAYAWMYGGFIWAYATQEESWLNAKKYAYEALSLNPDFTDILVLLKEGSFYFDLKVDAISDEFPAMNQIKLEKFNFDVAYKLGYFEDTKRALENSLKVNPNLSTNYAILALTYYLEGNDQTATMILDNNYELHKDDINFLRESSKTYYYLGAYDKMQIAVDDFYQTFVERPSIILWLKAILSDRNGDHLDVRKIIEELRTRFEMKQPGSPGWFLALYYAYKGNRELTIDWLQKSYKRREVEMTWLAQEPQLRFLKNDPDYNALLDSMNFPDYARRPETIRKPVID